MCDQSVHVLPTWSTYVLCSEEMEMTCQTNPLVLARTVQSTDIIWSLCPRSVEVVVFTLYIMQLHVSLSDFIIYDIADSVMMTCGFVCVAAFKERKMLQNESCPSVLISQCNVVTVSG